MKTTNKEHIILKEKLQEVDLPDMDKAWDKMDQQLGASPPSTGAISSFLGKFRLYLNLFIGVALLSLVAFFVASKPKKANRHVADIPVDSSYSKSNDLASFTYLTVNFNHENDLPVPATVVPQMEPEIIIYRPVPTPVIMESVPLMKRISVPNVFARTFNFNYGFKQLFNDSAFATDASPDIRFNRSDMMKYRIRQNTLGVSAQAFILPEFSSRNIIHNIGLSVFGRKFISPNSAMQIELSYNPIAIRPVTYEETFNVFNNFNYTQTDSAVVTSLKYVSLPITFYLQPNDQMSVNIGPQISLLTGLQGNLSTRLNYPTAPEGLNTTEQVPIQNRGGFATTDLGMVLEFNYRFKRVEMGFKFQQGFTDFTRNKVSTATHRSNALQLKASWIINK